MKSVGCGLVILFTSLTVSTIAEEGYCDAKDATCNSDQIQEKLRNKMVVAAIDFGTTYSGWAYQTKYEYKRDPTNIKTSKWEHNDILSKKTPTTVLIKPDGKTLEAFGYVAETKYLTLAAEEEHNNYYFFKRFKMMLYDKKNLDSETMLTDDKGLQLPALTVFSLAIGFLKDNLLADLRRRDASWGMDDIHWVLTVPAIWNDTAKSFMRKSAVAAGIKNEDLQIALEPEAASLYCRLLPVEKQINEQGEGFVNNFQPGRKYMVLDAGGGTIDITVHEVMFGGWLKELYKASGGPWGGTKVDASFFSMLIELVGEDIWDIFKKECAYDYLELQRSFEVIKRTVTPETGNKLAFHFPQCLSLLLRDNKGIDIENVIKTSKFHNDMKMKFGRLMMSSDIGKEFFKPVLDSIVKSVSNLLSERAVEGTSAILMVGGFSESPMLQHAIRSAFSGHLAIFTPKDAELAIVKGAVNFGFRPDFIKERVARFTYGIDTFQEFIHGKHNPDKLYQIGGREICFGVFDMHVKVGTKIKYGTVQGRETYIPLYEEQERVNVVVVACEIEEPLYVTDEGCAKIGNVTIDITDKNIPLLERQFLVEFTFSDTEIKVEATEIKTNKTRGTIDVTVHELLSEIRLKELYKATGGPWGGIEVDRAFEEVLSIIMGGRMYEAFKEQCAYDHLDMMRGFEQGKRSITPDKDTGIVVRLPLCFVRLLEQENGETVVNRIANAGYSDSIRIRWDRMILSNELSISFFKDVLQSVSEHIISLLDKPELSGIDSLLLVGGFADSTMLQDAIQSALATKIKNGFKVFSPPDAELVIVKGAVLFGFKPQSIEERIAAFTYGIKTVRNFVPEVHDKIKCNKFFQKDVPKCDNLFAKLVEIGVPIRYGEVQGTYECLPLTEESRNVTVFIYACSDRYPEYVIDDGCERRGQIDLELMETSKPLHERTITVSFMFSDTEITVSAKENLSGNKVEAKIKFD